MKASEIWANPNEFKPIKVGCMSKEAILNTDDRTLNAIDEINTMTQYIVDSAKNSPRLPGLLMHDLYVKNELYNKIFVSLLDVFGIVQKTKTFYTISHEESEDE